MALFLSESQVPFPSERRLINRRQIWAANRFWMEMQNLKTKRYGNKGTHHWFNLLLMLKAFKLILHLTGLKKRGIRNAENIKLNEMSLHFSNLPEAFDGFTVLHLSDLHIDSINGLEDRVLNLLGDRTVDVCFLTGDYRTGLHGLHKNVVNRMHYLIERIKSRDGFIGVLGNHDGCHMVNPLEKIGINMLVNSRHFISRGKDRIQIIGTDDVHYYYTDQALHALEHADSDFSIALVHSPELFDQAATMGVDLYLCGHTHAGQACLPGGRPIITHLDRGRQFFRGHWTYAGMQGVTHAGVGTSGIPVRFNTQGEVIIFTLNQSERSFK